MKVIAKEESEKGSVSIANVCEADTQLSPIDQ